MKQQEHQKPHYWQNVSGQRRGPSLSTVETLILFGKGDLRVLGKILTGHVVLRYYFNKVWKAGDQLCGLCQEHLETSQILDKNKRLGRIMRFIKSLELQSSHYNRCYRS
ncbi:hypothetical protein Trydic_g16971 [Trypoxylus dichotomus]